MNVLINARDAMAQAERKEVTVQTQNVEISGHDLAMYHQLSPGRYVSIAVTDTGSGMPPEVVSRVMEPFFTTKEEGQGTGLGLSMVYGFVKQSGGTVRIYSEVGEGTTVRLYFPASSEFENDLQAAKSRAIDKGATKPSWWWKTSRTWRWWRGCFWKTPVTASCLHPADARRWRSWRRPCRWMRCSPT